MTNGKRDDSEYGGDSPPGVMDPGPQPKPDKPPATQPAPDDESKKGSG
jgi:hypothetical protein